MANANESQSSSNVTLDLFGGLVSDPSPVDLPPGVSPDNSDMAYEQGSTHTRAGLARTYGTPLATDINFATTFTLPDGTPTTLEVGADGNLYQSSDLTSTPTLVSAGPASLFPAGSLVRGQASNTRQYLAAFRGNEIGGAGAPAVWDGQTLTRFTQSGPAQAVVPVEQNLNVGIVSITQPGPIGQLPETQQLSIGSTSIDFFQNTTGVYTGTGTQTNPTTYTGGTSLTFNQRLNNFPVPSYPSVFARSPMSQQNINPDGSWASDTFSPESARMHGDGYGFDCCVQTVLKVETAGEYTLYSLIDDGWNLFLGNAATGGGTVTYISGSRVGPEASSKAGNTYIAGRNNIADSGRTWDTIKVSFSAPGNYPLELGWSNWSDGPNCDVMLTWAAGDAPVAGGQSPIGQQFLPIAAAGNVSCTQSGGTVTCVTPVPHPFGVNDLALVADMNVDGYNGLQKVTSVPSPYSFTYELDVQNLATGTGGTVAPVTATCICADPHGLLVDDGIVINGNSESKFNNGTTDLVTSVVTPGNWVVKAITDPYTFQFDCVENAGDTGTGGTVTCGGQLAPGVRKICCFYEFMDGSYSQPGPTAQINCTGNKKLTVYNLPIGPANVRARCVASTGAAGGNWFFLPADIVGSQSTLGGLSSPALIATSTRIPDNTTQSVTLDFSDESLLASFAIDVDGGNLFRQSVLGPCQGVIEFADRLFIWGEYNGLSNLQNLSFDAQNLPGTPAGWNSAYTTGNLAPGNLGGYAWRFVGDGTSSAQSYLAQYAFQDALNVPILAPNTKYLMRAFLQPDVTGTRPLTGTLTVQFFGGGAAIATASVNLSTIPNTGMWVTVPFSAATGNSIPSDTILQCYTTSIATGAFLLFDELAILPATAPVVGTQMRGSYAFNVSAFDGVTGKLQIPGTAPITDGWVYRDQLFIATTKSLYYTTDAGSGTEPSSWAINEVSNRIGSFCPRSSDGTDDRYFVANRSGVYILSGTQLTLVSAEVKKTWDKINWSASRQIWLRVDSPQRMLYIGLPLNGSATVSTVLTCSFRGVQDEIDVPAPIHISIQGKVVASDNARKWSPWQLAAACGQILTYPSDDKMSFGLIGKGNLYSLDPTKLHDDDLGRIPAYYVTYFFLSPEDEQQFSTGSHRKLVQYMTASARGTGNILVTPMVDSLENTKRPLRQKPLTSGTVTKDVEWPANVLGERIAFRFEALPVAPPVPAPIPLAFASSEQTGTSGSQLPGTNTDGTWRCIGYYGQGVVSGSPANVTGNLSVHSDGGGSISAVPVTAAAGGTTSFFLDADIELVARTSLSYYTLTSVSPSSGAPVNILLFADGPGLFGGPVAEIGTSVNLIGTLPGSNMTLSLVAYDPLSSQPVALPAGVSITAAGVTLTSAAPSATIAAASSFAVGTPTGPVVSPIVFLTISFPQPALDAHFSLRRVVLTVSPDLLTPVGGRV